MVVALHSPNGAQNTLDLGNFATSRVIDELRRVNGVGDVQLFGSEYAMRIWLDPAKLVAYNLSAAEALEAVREQNSQRSEEHTSELQSLMRISYAVFCLKKKKHRT